MDIIATHQEKYSQGCVKQKIPGLEKWKFDPCFLWNLREISQGSSRRPCNRVNMPVYFCEHICQLRRVILQNATVAQALFLNHLHPCFAFTFVTTQEQNKCTIL